MRRGEIWWADLPEPRGSEPGFRRPALIIQADSFNASRIQTVLIAIISSNLGIAAAPGNVCLPVGTAGLTRESVVNVSQILTVDRRFMAEFSGTLPRKTMERVDQGLRLVMEI